MAALSGAVTAVYIPPWVSTDHIREVHLFRGCCEATHPAKTYWLNHAEVCALCAQRWRRGERPGREGERHERTTGHTQAAT